MSYLSSYSADQALGCGGKCQCSNCRSGGVGLAESGYGCGGNCGCRSCRSAGSPVGCKCHGSLSGFGERYIDDDDDDDRPPRPQPGPGRMRTGVAGFAGFAAPPRDVLDTEHRSRGGTLPYRQAMEQTEQGAYEEYVRNCNGVTVTEHVDRSANSPRERVQILERVLGELPAVFRFKTELDGRVRARSITQGEATRQLTERFQQLGYHPTYVPGTEAAELAKTRCALSRARWDFMAYEHRGSHPCNTTLDLTARSIIAAAQNASVAIEARAVQNVRNILNTYFPNEVAKVSGVQWEDALGGLRTTSQGAGPTATGIISVGRTFTEATVERHFARRVLQTGHELRHIDQYRAGMVGPPRQAEREFLAHYWAATTPPKPGTGCMVKGTWVSIIDCSLSFRNCMPVADRAKYPGYEQKLLDIRNRLRPATPWPPAGGMPACPPTGC